VHRHRARASDDRRPTDDDRSIDRSIDRRSTTSARARDRRDARGMTLVRALAFAIDVDRELARARPGKRARDVSLALY